MGRSTEVAQQDVPEANIIIYADGPSGLELETLCLCSVLLGWVLGSRPLYTSTTSFSPRLRSIGHNLAALLSALEFFYAEPAMLEAP